MVSLWQSSLYVGSLCSASYYPKSIPADALLWPRQHATPGWLYLLRKWSFSSNSERLLDWKTGLLKTYICCQYFSPSNTFDQSQLVKSSTSLETDRLLSSGLTFLCMGRFYLANNKHNTDHHDQCNGYHSRPLLLLNNICQLRSVSPGAWSSFLAEALPWRTPPSKLASPSTSGTSWWLSKIFQSGALCLQTLSFSLVYDRQNQLYKNAEGSQQSLALLSPLSLRWPPTRQPPTLW